MTATLDGSLVAKIEGPTSSGLFHLIMNYKDELKIMKHSDLDFLREEAHAHFGHIYWHDFCELEIP